MAYFTIDDVSYTSFRFTLADLQFPFDSKYYSNFVLKIDGEIVSMVTPSGVPSGLQTISFYYTDSDGSTIASGESYDISCTVYTAGGTAWNIPTQPNGNIYVETITMKSSAGNINIPLWTWEGWTSSYNAITQKKATTDFSYKAWNEIVSKVLDVLHNGLDLSWDIGYANAADTKMRSSDTELTAIRFNSVRNNIELAGTHPDIGIGKIPNSDIPHPVYPGDYVLGEYFLTLTNYINDCIKVLNNK